MTTKTYHYHQEQMAIESWMKAVMAASKASTEHGLAMAQLAVLARGYGSVRKRGLNQLEVTFKNLEQNIKANQKTALTELVSLLEAARNNPDQKCGS